MSDRAVALVDAPPASAAATAWEDLLFGPTASSEPFDPLAVLDDDTLTAFVLVEATPSGTMVMRHGDAAVAINGRKVSIDYTLTDRDLLHGRTILFRRGKKRWLSRP